MAPHRSPWLALGDGIVKPTAAELAAVADRFRHHHNCTHPRLQGAVGKRDGAPLAICRGCRAGHAMSTLTGEAHEPAEPTTTAATPDTSTTRTAAAPWLTHRCREHYAPVNWKGHGCPRCDRDRARPRRKTQPTDTTE